jgi:hypothetical protein
MTNTQSTLPITPDFRKNIPLTVLFERNGNSYTVSTQSDVCVCVYIYIYIYIYVHIFHNIGIWSGKKFYLTFGLYLRSKYIFINDDCGIWPPIYCV